MCAIHHLHRRKRIHQEYEHFPHPDKFKRFVDKIVYLAGILMPIVTIPQVVTIWVHKNSAGVSLVSWTAYLIIALVFAAYGVIHKAKPLIIMYSSMVVLDALIIIGVMLF